MKFFKKKNLKRRFCRFCTACSLYRSSTCIQMIQILNDEKRNNKSLWRAQFIFICLLFEFLYRLIS